MAAISLTETSLSDDINIPTQGTSSSTMLMSQSTTTTDSSTVSNGDGNYSNQYETKQIYDMEDKFELNYKRLRDDLKKIKKRNY
jgi:hypothetical protein